MSRVDAAAGKGSLNTKDGVSRAVVAVLAWVLALGLLVAPVVLVFAEALRHGGAAALASFSDPDAWSAIRLTLVMTVLAVAINTAFGILAAWLVTKYRFSGRGVLLAMIELPLSISPVVAGLAWVLLFGLQGWFGPTLARWHVDIVFAPPGILLATLFVTFPYVTRTLTPLLEAQGAQAEEAASVLGAGMWSTLWRVTLPGAASALASGVLLTTARALGEFGAVSVVSGHIPGLTETMPLHIETLYNGYQSVAAFSMAALLALFAILIVALRGLAGGRRPIEDGLA
ncbi:sulfate ABC transporter permease [Tanticharoenia sakaeratensis]|uniref:Sulfate ABC transporter inner membrane subunit n=1 Tax=Tanticharoenia sakaeratensis NBRC 103193 TaxID=1231623 RepID=A0A0D6MHR9_9PROT|nr:sulfate ABC transporter permease subunit [Tanticharoenia sakaeratensis]GAN52793.1 sulfate ABC transporter inner membrane subunit [Tanticharoenia sakaeratensis NBRC 103193]GBQ18035.1 sulfate transporter permease CysW [Tanticharoenia sakaeratensis NBRC 103193]